MDNNTSIQQNPDWMEDTEGQLAIDVFQTADDVMIKAPIAGVNPTDLEISITDEVINIKGERKTVEDVTSESYFAQECYWGSFSRSYVLPVAINSEKAAASLKNGILTIKVPKLEKTKTRMIEIKNEE